MAADFLRIVNFERYQHADALRGKRGTERGMLFVRLNVDTRLRAEFSGRGGRNRFAQWCWILCWAGETLNKLPAHASAWRREFGGHGTQIRDDWIARGQLAPWTPAEPSPDTDGAVAEQSLSSNGAATGHSLSKEMAQPSGSNGRVAGHSAGTDLDADSDSNADADKAGEQEKFIPVLAVGDDGREELVNVHVRGFPDGFLCLEECNERIEQLRAGLLNGAWLSPNRIVAAGAREVVDSLEHIVKLEATVAVSRERDAA